MAYDLPLALEQLTREGRILPTDNWGPCAQTGTAYAGEQGFAAKWRGISAVPTEIELQEAYDRSIGVNATLKNTAQRTTAKGLLTSGEGDGKSRRAIVSLLIDELNTLRQQIIGVATLSWNPANMANNTGVTSPNFTVTGAVFGDVVDVAAPYSLAGVIACGYVSAANTVSVRLHNGTGSAVDLAVGNWKVIVRRHVVLPDRNLGQAKTAYNNAIDNGNANGVD